MLSCVRQLIANCACSAGRIVFCGFNGALFPTKQLTAAAVLTAPRSRRWEAVITVCTTCNWGHNSLKIDNWPSFFFCCLTSEPVYKAGHCTAGIPHMHNSARTYWKSHHSEPPQQMWRLLQASVKMNTISFLCGAVCVLNGQLTQCRNHTGATISCAGSNQSIFTAALLARPTKASSWTRSPHFCLELDFFLPRFWMES